MATSKGFAFCDWQVSQQRMEIRGIKREGTHNVTPGDWLLGTGRGIRGIREAPKSKSDTLNERSNASNSGAGILVTLHLFGRSKAMYNKRYPMSSNGLSPS
uniref:Uncharacterized protein n=1 Tax=Anguilla anguilla TaxID=7936 RepID=A0A0E9WW82_ANGAN